MESLPPTEVYDAKKIIPGCKFTVKGGDPKKILKLVKIAEVKKVKGVRKNGKPKMMKVKEWGWFWVFWFSEKSF